MSGKSWITALTKCWPDTRRSIQVTISDDQTVTVRDNGRGFPVGKHHQMKDKDTLEVIHTVLHAGGKFGGGGYKVSSGLHGVGASAVNAVSSYMRVESHKDGRVYAQEYERGKPLGPVKSSKWADGDTARFADAVPLRRYDLQGGVAVVRHDSQPLPRTRISDARATDHPH